MSEEIEITETNGNENKDKDYKEKKPIDEESNAAKANEKKNDEEDSIDLEAEIIRQVEYYFGDVNLPRDKFLRDQVELDDGWVPLEVLCKFNRLSKLSTDIEFIEKVLNKSTSGLLEVADKKVRRNPEQPVPEMNEDRRKDIMRRTIYAKGFPKDSTLDELLRFFKKFDKVENVIMRRYLDTRTKTRPFKGSVFATFKTKEQAEKFMESKNSLKYKDTDLLVLWQEEYSVMKQEERKDRHKKKERKIKEKQDKTPEQPSLSLPTGTVMYFEDGNEKMTREEIKTAFSNTDKKYEIAFIDFKIGLTKGWIRFTNQNDAVEFHKLLNNGNIEIGDHSITLRVLEGEEEKEYLRKTVDEMTKRRKNMKMFKQKGKGNHYKDKHNMKRRRDNENEDAPAAKVKCDS